MTKRNTLFSSLSPMLLSASLLLGCGSSLTAPDQAVQAAGGKDALLALTSQSVTATGQRLETSQTKKAGDPPFQIGGDFNYTLTQDVKGDRINVAWVRPSLLGQTFMYSEVTNQKVGYFNGVDSAFTMMTPTPMLSSRVAAVRKHARLFQPHLILRRMLEANQTATVLADASVNGVAHSVIELPDAFLPVRLFIDKASGQLAKVETTEDDPIRGDALIEVAFEDYRPVTGLMLPFKATLSVNGVVLHKEIRSNVTVNGAVSDALFAIPAAVQSMPNSADSERGEAISEFLQRFAALGFNFDFDQSTSVMSTNVGQGVYLIHGANAHTLAVELATQIVAVEAPIDDARSRVVIAEIKKLFPGKPIKYIINTHHHDDHAGGLRTYVSEGATVVTSALNEAYFKQVFSAAHKARPDTLEQKPAAAKIQAVGSAGFDIMEGARKVRVLPVPTTHADGMMYVYVEDARVVMVADLFSPGFFPMNAPITGPFAAGAKEIYATLAASGLNIQAIVGVHGFGTATLNTLKTNAGM